MAMAAHAAPQPMTAVDIVALARPTAAIPAPDGSTILYKIREANWDRNRTSTRLWSANRAGRAERLTGPRGEIAWSPDGRTLAYATKRDDDKVAQIYLTTDGGRPRRLTALQTEPSDLQWSADGARILFATNRPDDAATTARIKAKDDMFAFEVPRRRRLLGAVDVKTGKVDVLAAGDYDVRKFSASSASGFVVYEAAPSRLLDDQRRSELWMLNTASGSRRRLTSNDYRENDPKLAPDGRKVLFIANADGGRYATVNRRLFVLDAGSGSVQQLAEGKPWEIEEAIWSADGSRVYFAAQDGVRVNLFAVAADGGAAKALDACDCVISSLALSRDGHTLTYLKGSASQPPEVFRLDPVQQDAPMQVSHVNDDITKRFQLPRQEAIRWSGPEGQELEGLVTYPLNYEPGRRYPLIVQSHGGPRNADKFGLFSYSRYLPVLAAQGFATLTVNYRGSTGYGDKFLQGMNGGYFRIADRDVLSGVDELVKRGVADPNSLGAMGWSAGGHMTAWLTTVTNRFKAAIVGAGAVDWASLYLGSDTRWQRREFFLTPPYGSKARRDLYTDNSPLTKIDAAKTPTLILAGAQDKRVPPAQSVMLYRALKDQGVPTELYLAPREPHNFRELRHRLFQINAGMRWLTTYVTGKSYTPAYAPGTSVGVVDAEEDRPTEQVEEPEEPRVEDGDASS